MPACVWTSQVYTACVGSARNQTHQRSILLSFCANAQKLPPADCLDVLQGSVSDSWKRLIPFSHVDTFQIEETVSEKLNEP